MLGLCDGSCSTFHLPRRRFVYSSGGRGDGSVLYTAASVFIPGLFFFGGGEFPPPKNLQFPQTAAKLCDLNLFFGWDEFQIYHGNFLLMDNKHRELFAIKQSKGANLCLKCTIIRLATPGSARTRWWSLCAFPDSLTAMGSLFPREGGMKG